MNAIKKKVVAVLLTFFGLLYMGTSQAAEPDKVVYHIDNAGVQATKAMRNIRNHLDTVPSTKVIVVTHADGVDFY